MDVSGSMRATDVLPDRMIAAQEAAKAFVSRTAAQRARGRRRRSQARPRWCSRRRRTAKNVVAAIDRFQLQRGTAIGSGIVLSLATLFPDAGIDLSQITGQRNMPLGPGDKPPKEFTPVAPGSFSSAAIVLLTDGRAPPGRTRSTPPKWPPTAA